MKPIIRSSSMDRCLSCPGSVTLTALVDEREGDEGHEGTYLHWAIADRAIRELGATPPEGGLPPPDVPKGYKLPAFSLWIVDWAIRHIRETIPADWSLMVEVEMEHEFARWRNRGHADIVALSPDATRSIGLDWKTGRDPKDSAESNEQVASYLILKKLSWPTLRESEFQICQPRVNEEDGIQRVSRVVVTDLDALVASMDARVCVALDKPMCLKTGKQCTYCIGMSCYAIQAEQKFMEITMTPEMLAKIKRTPDDATLADFVIIGRRLEKPLKDATEMLHERLDTNPVIVAGSGAQITRTMQRGDYSVPDPLKFMQAVRTILPDDESIAQTFTPSMTRIKDRVAHVMNIPKTGKASVTAETVFDGHLRPLVEQGQKRILHIL